MKNENNAADTLFERMKEFSIAYTELIKLKAINLASIIISAIIPDIVFSLLMFTVVLFLTIGMAIWLGGVIGKLYMGFILVGSFYLVIGLISHFILRGWFKRRIGNYFIKNIFRDTDL
jgi:hypothetical protein